MLLNLTYYHNTVPSTKLHNDRYKVTLSLREIKMYCPVTVFHQWNYIISLTVMTCFTGTVDGYMESIGRSLVYLTHFPLVPYICVSGSCQHCFRQWLVTYSVPSHYLNQCWVIITWTRRNKLRWNFSQKSKFFIYKNAFENVVYEMAPIFSMENWVNKMMLPVMLHVLTVGTFSMISIP